jgi:Holliday junction DNA helicase RuvA
MISYLKGRIVKKTDRGIIADTGSIGYFVHLPKNLLDHSNEKEEIELFIHSHIREDAFDLYGFEEFSELEFFKQLLEVNGVGPKVAMEILTIPTEDIKNAIVNKDSAFICRIKGIGKKTADRLILELKGKVTPSGLAGSNRKYKDEEDINDDIAEALMKFGYNKQQIKSGLKDLPSKVTKTEEIITYFLKHTR